MELYEKRWRKAGLLEYRLGARPHQVDGPFENPDDLMDLSFAVLSVLATGEHV